MKNRKSDYMNEEHCSLCKFLYPLEHWVWCEEEQVNHCEKSHVCLLFPLTEEKDDICFAMVIDEPERGLCESFTPR